MFRIPQGSVRLATVFADLPRTGRVCSVRSRSNFCFRGRRQPPRALIVPPRGRAPPHSNTSVHSAPKPGPARLSKTARRGRAQSCRSSAAAWKAHVSRRRCRRPPATGTPTAPTRLTLKTDDRAPILVTYNGIRQTTNAGASLQIAPLFETGDSRYAWLTRPQAVGVGERGAPQLSTTSTR